MNENLSQKYILILSVVAVVILVVGSALRPKKAPVMQQPSPSERASLQRAVRREELREIGAIFADRATAVARNVVYLPDRNASGVLWGSPGLVLTSGKDAPVETVQIGTMDSPPVTVSGESGGRWIVIAGKSAEQKLVWTVAMDGVTKGSDCDGVPYRELVLNAPLSKVYEGAGAFDVDGALVGLVMRCGTSYHLAAATSFQALLKSAKAPEKTLASHYGLRVSAKAAQLLDGENGLLVTELIAGGSAARLGLRAGDRIVSVGDRAVSTEAELLDALSTGEAASTTVIRAGRKAVIKPEAASDLGITLMPVARVSSAITVVPETPAYKAGLRTGDRILQIGTRTEPTAAEVQRMLAASDGKPLLIVYERDSMQGAVVIER